MPALKELTAARLASLNHGSIRSPLPGSEAGIVLAKVREWNRKVPEIHIGGDPRNPVIRVQLSDVDYESVVENAKGEDNEGRRRELLKDLVREAIGITERDPDVFGVYAHPVIWRGSRREVDVVFGNVRDAGWLTEDHFRARPGTWRFVIDYPFDEAGHSAAEDLDRVDRLAEGGLKSRTIVWLPRFLSEDRMRDVRRLVILDWLLSGTGERWTTQRRPPVRGGPGAGQGHPGEPAHRRCGRRCAARCRSATARRRRPPAPWPRTARTTGCWSASTRASPRPRRSARTWPRRSATWSTRRSARPTRGIRGSSRATSRSPCGTWPRCTRTWSGPWPTRSGGSGWRATSPPSAGSPTRCRSAWPARRTSCSATTGSRGARSSSGPPPATASSRRTRSPWARSGAGWTRSGPQLGLRDEVADLIVLAWAALRQRAWYQHGSSIPAPRPGATRPDMELRPEPLPAPADWEAATSRAEVLFGIQANPYLTAAGLAEFTETLRARLDVVADSAAGLVQRVELAYQHLGLPDDRPGRLATARAGATLVEALRRAGGRVRLVETLARAELPPPTPRSRTR